MLREFAAGCRERPQARSEDRLLQDRQRVVPRPRGVLESPLDPADRPLQRIELNGNVAPIVMHLQVQLAADVAQLDGDVVVAPLVEVVVARVDGRLRHDVEPGSTGARRIDSDRQPCGLHDTVLVNEGDASLERLLARGQHGEQCQRALPGRGQDHPGGSQPDDRRARLVVGLDRQFRERPAQQLSGPLAAIAHIAGPQFTAEHPLQIGGVERRHVGARQFDLYRHDDVAVREVDGLLRKHGAGEGNVARRHVHAEQVPLAGSQRARRHFRRIGAPGVRLDPARHARRVDLTGLLGERADGVDAVDRFGNELAVAQLVRQVPARTGRSRRSRSRRRRGRAGSDARATERGRCLDIDPEVGCALRSESSAVPGGLQTLGHAILLLGDGQDATAVECLGIAEQQRVDIVAKVSRTPDGGMHRHVVRHLAQYRDEPVDQAE